MGIAVKNIDRTLAAFTKAFNLPKVDVLDVPEKQVKVAVLHLNGFSLEFLEEYASSGPLQKLVEERGNAIHHFCIETDNIKNEIKVLKSRGMKMLDPEPKKGLRGKRIAFVHPDSLDGLMVELSEP